MSTSDIEKWKKQTDKKHREKVFTELTTCKCCKKKVNLLDGQAAYNAIGIVFCSQYCFEKFNGTPLPCDNGTMTFNKIFNQ